MSVSEKTSAAIVAAVRDASRLPTTTDAVWTSVGGSALNRTAALALGAHRFFVKINAPAFSETFAAERDGLFALAQSGAMRVPHPVAFGVAGDAAFLALEWLDIRDGGRDASLGRALAALHRCGATRFGWHRDNTIGTTPQRNRWTGDWATFFRDSRLAPQLELAGARGGRGALQRLGAQLLDAVPVLLAGHAPEPSLVHGDLWSGNAAALASGEPVIFDPAAYYGDREVDIAMSELFGGFGADFHAAYRHAWPLASGYETRRTLYNLYHVLNHLNLFGGSYATQAQAMIERLLARLR